MNYRESEREKALRMRNSFFEDLGNGIHQGKHYPFILINPEKNLWKGIRKDAIKYFEDNKIVWWPGSDKLDIPLHSIPLFRCIVYHHSGPYWAT